METFNWIWIIVGLLFCLWGILFFKIKQIDNKLDKTEFEQRMQSLEVRRKEDKEDMKTQLLQLKHDLSERITNSEASIKEYITALISSKVGKTNKKE